jgi:hypothetical protein
MKYLYSFLALICFSLPVFSADVLYIKAPSEVKIEKTRIKDLQIETNIKNVLWFVTDDRLSIIQINEKRAVIQGVKDATISINLFYAEGDMVKGPVVIKVIVGTGDPDKPEPGPGPDPVPGPSSDLEKALAAAYKADSVTKDKLTAKNTLINYYKAAISSTIKDKDLDTVGKLFGVLSMTAKEVMGDNLDSTRKEIQKYLDSKLPKKTDTKLDDTLRALYEEEFKKLVVALEKI